MLIALRCADFRMPLSPPCRLQRRRHADDAHDAAMPCHDAAPDTLLPLRCRFYYAAIFRHAG